MNPSDIEPFLTTKVFGRGLIEVHQTIGTTMDRARDLAQGGALPGTVVLAETQTAGRGRHGRNWHSPPGRNLYFSLILPADLPLETTPLVTLAAGLGASETVSRLTGLAPEIKWPNDLLLDGRKLAGILTEMDLRGTTVRSLILGLGLNVNLAESDVPDGLKSAAGSLLISSGRAWERPRVLAAVLGGLERRIEDLMQGRSQKLLADYRTGCRTLGREISLAQGREVIQGRAQDVDEQGRLVVRTSPDGRLIQVSAGEVTLLKK